VSNSEFGEGLPLRVEVVRSGEFIEILSEDSINVVDGSHPVVFAGSAQEEKVFLFCV
jgi:hypothetical protein